LASLAAFWDGRLGGSLAGDALALLGAVLWAATTIVIKATPLRRIDPMKVLLYQLDSLALTAPLVAYAFGEAWPTHLTTTSAVALLWQGVVVAGISYALWFWTLTRYAVAELSAFTFITPLVGVLAGWLVFGETITGGFRSGDRAGPGGTGARQTGRGARVPRKPTDTQRERVETAYRSALRLNRRAQIALSYLAPSVASKNATASSIAVLMRRGAWDLRRADGIVSFPADVHFGKEVIVADMRQRREFGSGDERRGDLAIGCRRATFVGVAEKDTHGGRMALRLSGSRLWTRAGAITNAAFTPGMLRSSLRWARAGATAGCLKKASASERE